MTGILRVHWTLAPAHPPVPRRHCSSCGVIRAFNPSGKIRLNANGTRLDAWLIYRCAVCKRTWLRTLLERAPVRRIPQDELDAMQQSAPAWVQKHEHDVRALKRQSADVICSNDVHIIKPGAGPPCEPHQAIELALNVPAPTGLRLDRILARELPVTRSRLQAIHARGGLVIAPEARHALKRKLASDMTIRFCAKSFLPAEFAALREAMFA